MRRSLKGPLLDTAPKQSPKPRSLDRKTLHADRGMLFLESWLRFARAFAALAGDPASASRRRMILYTPVISRV